MKVRTAFDFSDDQLRAIRAAHGRGGVATRKESVGFILRAVEAALKAAPTPKPKRRPVPPAPKAAAPVVTAPLSEEDAVRAKRDAIRKMYRTAAFAGA